MELILKDLTKKFGSKTAVNHVSASFSPGVYGLLGANGAGKTTLMRVMCCRQPRGKFLWIQRTHRPWGRITAACLVIFLRILDIIPIIPRRNLCIISPH